jgi:hypothetical protein
MSLVVHNGIQYDTSRLPKGVDPKKCTPVDEWFKKNREEAPADKASAGDGAGSKVVAELRKEIAALRDEVAEARAAASAATAAVEAAAADPADKGAKGKSSTDDKG